MNQKRKRISYYFIASVICLIGILLSAKPIVQKLLVSNLEKRGIVLTTDGIEFKFCGMVVKNPKIKSDNFNANLKEIVLKIGFLKVKEIHLESGTISIFPNGKNSKETKNGSYIISGSNLDLTYGAINVNKFDFKVGDGKKYAKSQQVIYVSENYEINGIGFIYNNGDITINELNMNLKKLPSSFSRNNDGGKANIGEVQKKINSFKIQKMELKTNFGNANIENVSIDVNRKNFSASSIDIYPFNNNAELLIDGASVSIQKIDNYYSFDLKTGDVIGSHSLISDSQANFGPITSHSDFKKEDESLFINSETKLGKIIVKSSLKKGNEFDLNIELVNTNCQNLIDSTPSQILEDLNDIKIKGDINVVFSLKKDDKFVSHLSMKHNCYVTSIPEKYRYQQFTSLFTKETDINGKIIKRKFGKDSENWVNLNSISNYMPNSVVFTEDAGFWKHNGFISDAIANSISMNLSQEKFVRGGSTISMQLSKNLWLDSKKTLSRKLKEFFLTIYLENSFSKEEIMELYLNVVEFGPNVYGIKEAADFYFKKRPSELTLKQSLFLASILPSPRTNRFKKSGELNENWDSFLNRLIEMMKEKKAISEEEYEEAKSEKLVKSDKPKMNEIVDTWNEESGIDPNSWN